jgi:hypothetical protein
MEIKDWCVKWHSSDEWFGCKPGYYWGDVDRQRMVDEKSGEVLLGNAVGPFKTAADAALDMVRTWAIQSVERKGVN